MNVAKRIRESRQRNGLTQKELANLVNVSPQVVSNWERNYTNPDHDDIARLAKALNVSADVLLGQAKKREIDIIDIIQNNDYKLIAGGHPLTHEQRINVLHALDKPQPILAKKNTIPILGTIRTGVPLLADSNCEGELETPSDIMADFVLRVRGDSMIGIGIHEGDYAICREAQSANSGQIVVGLQDIATGFTNATLRYYFKENGAAVLQSANPKYPDIQMNGDWRIGGVMIAVLKKDCIPYGVYNEYLSSRAASKEKWNRVIERALQCGIKPEQVIALIEMIYQTSRAMRDQSI